MSLFCVLYGLLIQKSHKTHFLQQTLSCMCTTTLISFEHTHTKRNRVLFCQVLAVLLRPRHENVNLQNSTYLHECPAVKLSCACKS